MIFTVTGQTPLTDTVYRLELAGDTAAITRPGQFVQIKVPGFYLRRPISVCDWGENSLTLIYKVVGQGTKAMTSLAPGAELDLLTGLGNGFDPAALYVYLFAGGRRRGRAAPVRPVQASSRRGNSRGWSWASTPPRRFSSGRISRPWACPCT